MGLESRRGFTPLPQIQVLLVVSDEHFDSCSQMSLFSSAVVLLLNVWAGKLSGFHGDPGKDVQGVVDCLNVMRTYENR
jgi:hypothetical protein